MLNEEQRKQLTEVIFHNPEVQRQLRQAEIDRKNGFVGYTDDEEEFARLVEAVNKT